ncbi:porin family protein [Spirosoma endophyticum]|uniref:Protein RodZ, contains Xre-like HTH and DUF4115 domains n=1 Tax=Spirosoma endophyticum TaxID=662367 RepID=A0A1I1T6D5_9BACT|nr:PorT family protein [Spirosoma endophyticum]SFD54194.1 protein RodZ, contains Xre-like HTH and DUF4115 domains [Spirosoma endophyticum]
MPELTDDQLDGLFRKSAEEFDPPFDPAAWQDMATRLDTHEQTQPGAPMWKSLLRWGLPALLLLLLTGGGWYAYREMYAVVDKPTRQVVTRTNSPLSRTSEQSQQYVAPGLPDSKPAQTTSVDSLESGAGLDKQPADLTKSVAESSKPENHVVAADKSENGVVKLSESENHIAKSATLRNRNTTSDKSESRVAESVTRLKTNTASKATDATKRVETAYGLKTKRNRTTRSQLATSVSTPIATLAAVEPNLVGNRAKKESLRRRNSSKPANSLADEALLATNAPTSTKPAFTKKHGLNSTELMQIGTTSSSKNVPALESIESGPVVLTDVHELAARPGKWPESTFANPDVVAQPETLTRSAMPKSTTQTQRGFSLRLVVAPDLSSVGLNNFSRPGTNFGVMLEYRLASRWSVQTGIIQSTKVYRAQPEEYDFPWMWPTDPSSIDGKCNMLDIPINVRYDFAIRPRQDGRLPSRWFVSGGVTSYIMKQEDYVYNYPPHTYNIKFTELNTSTGGYGFSQLNFSVGYERAFSKRLSWQVEPFIKAPLRGVGFFGVNLISTGAFFSIRYKLTNH